MTLGLYAIFFALVAAVLALDLGIARRRSHQPRPGEAVLSTLVWIMGAVACASLLAYAFQVDFQGLATAHERAFGERLDPDHVWTQFLTAYIVEIALSLDNVLAMAAVFTFLGTPTSARHRLLFAAILAGVLVRSVLIALGAKALSIPWMNYAFTGLLVLAMFRTLLMPDRREDFSKRWIVRTLDRLLPKGEADAKGRVRRPLIVGLVIAAVADLFFALDSIPAVFAVTLDPVVALTSNTLAVLTLRALYFAVAPVLGRFRFLRLSVTLVLLGLACKMLLQRHDPLSTLVVLGGVVGVVATGILASLPRRFDPGTIHEPRPAPIEDLAEAAAATRRNLRKVVVLIVGTVIILFGFAITPLPGPGPLIIVPVGLALLATEFVWAKRLLDRFKQQAARIQTQGDTLSRRLPRWAAVAVAIGYWGIVAAIAHLGPWSPWKVYLPLAGLFLPVAWWCYRTLTLPRSGGGTHRRGAEGGEEEPGKAHSKPRP